METEDPGKESREQPEESPPPPKRDEQRERREHEEFMRRWGEIHKGEPDQ
jgi:hypothetical protein